MKKPKKKKYKFLEAVKRKYNVCCSVPAHYLVTLLIVCQVLDGFLTYFGVKRFGIEGEGNPLLRYLMSLYEPLTVLLVVKILAIILLVILYMKDIFTPEEYKMLFLVPCLYVILIFYLFGAIIPWSIVLFLYG